MSLDPKQNRQDQERKKAAENKIPPLNPPFPFRVVAFDPWVFNLQKGIAIGTVTLRTQ